MIINPGSHDKQGPWDPNGRKKYFDLRYFWVLMPTLLLMVGLLVAGQLLIDWASRVSVRCAAYAPSSRRRTPG